MVYNNKTTSKMVIFDEITAKNSHFCRNRSKKNSFDVFRIIFVEIATKIN